MKEQPITPGPWSLSPRVGAAVIAPHGPGDPMRAPDVERYGGSLICENILNPADGRLICAAPELLKACLAMIDNPDQCDQGTWDRMVGRARKLARAAIAKATGEQP